MKKATLIALGLAVLYWLLAEPGAREHPPGVLAPSAPQQAPVNDVASWQIDGYEITPLATFNIEARVLAREEYTFDRGADLSPLDLALGWGNMSDQAVVDQIEITQRGRWYHWQVDEFPIPRREIEIHSANMHLIPAYSHVSGSMGKARVGDIVSLSGYLVKVTAGDGWNWSSSLTRDDTGDGACELIWVESFQIRG